MIFKPLASVNTTQIWKSRYLAVQEILVRLSGRAEQGCKAERAPVCYIDTGSRELVLDTADDEASLVLVVSKPAGHLRTKIW